MPFAKTIICLANSRKLGGNCVAGKDITNGQWIRPVSSSETGELYPQHIQYKNDEIPECLDIIEIEFERCVPKYYQPENMLITNRKWKKIRTFPKDNLDALCDTCHTVFQNIGNHTDRIPVARLQQRKITSSLIFIKVNDLIFHKTLSTSSREQVRAIFTFNGIEYDLVVTDLSMEKIVKREHDQCKVICNNIYLCISLGEPFNNYCYKLVPSVIFGTIADIEEME